MKSEFMKTAIDLAGENIQNNGGPFGAIIVKNGKIIGRGQNRVTADNDPTAHAEVMAIREACRDQETFDLSGCDIYTSCEPCPMCLGAIYWARLDKVFYAANRYDAAEINFDDEFIYLELDKSIEERSLNMINIDREPALDVFKSWKNKEDKTPY